MHTEKHNMLAWKECSVFHLQPPCNLTSGPIIAVAMASGMPVTQFTVGFLFHPLQPFSLIHPCIASITLSFTLRTVKHRHTPIKWVWHCKKSQLQIPFPLFKNTHYLLFSQTYFVNHTPLSSAEVLLLKQKCLRRIEWEKFCQNPLSLPAMSGMHQKWLDVLLIFSVS